MRNAIVTLGIVFLLTACAGGRPSPIQQSGMMKRSYAEPIVVYPGDSLSNAATKAMSAASLANSNVAIAEYSLFTHGPGFYRRWPQSRKHKVIAYGFPERCGMRAGWYGVESADLAIQKTLQQCLGNVEKLGKALDIKCGCQVTAYNDVVFVDPDRMSYRSSLPAVAMIVENGQTQGKEIQGFIKYDGSIGKDLPISFYNEEGRLICDGKHSVNMLTMSGDFSLSCFNGAMKGEGDFQVDGMRQGRTYGTAKATTGNETMYIVFGLSDDDYEKKKAELLNGG
ncbi:hypothetical protein RYZ26_10455 [Terasakiella sp. A23]|uniref:hypothetical protein n=1 Tax=Terasakiella sp. FCG-A23 TaxID=3080561 RepID=UPI002952C1DB|nr:hypothetical protein [Terasakiella sp. A23]MDV7340016.1 hypothetical protein [Terasakiella sp. A23]